MPAFAVENSKVFFCVNQTIGLLVESLPAAAIDSSSPSFSKHPPDQVYSNYLYKMHVDLRGEPDYVQTIYLLTEPIYGYLDAGGHANLVVSVVEWNTLGADNTLL